MVNNDTDLAVSHIMTPDTMAAYMEYESEKGASANMMRRFSRAVKCLYETLPEDKTVTRERLLQWRESMDQQEYSAVTVQNYVKYINRYLRFAGCPEICFSRGKGKDIAGQTFGYLTAIEPTGGRDRKDILWKCQCRCGNIVEITATRLLSENTLSCGCLHREHLQRVNQYIDRTSLRQALSEQVESTRSSSGYTGVTAKRNKWQAYIRYKGKHYSLGCYDRLEDAVKARAYGKELVREDALELLKKYVELHKDDAEIPRREHSSR